MKDFRGTRSPKGWAVAVPLCRPWQRSQLCRIFVFPPNLMLIMLKKKQFHSPLLAAPRWNVGYVSCSPQPTKKKTHFFFFSPKFCFSEGFEFVLLRAVDRRCVRSTGSSSWNCQCKAQPVTIRVCKNVQSPPANLPRTTWNSPSSKGKKSQTIFP